jgi:PadR family transcriptional regulator AphA
MPTGTVNFRHFILGLLSQQPRSGYDIKRLLKSLAWLIDGPSFGNIYSTLHALLEEGLLSVEVVPHHNKPSRKVYSITEAGRQTWQEWADQPVVPANSLKAFLMRLSLANSFSSARLIEHLQQRQARVAAHYAALTESVEMLAERSDVQHLTLDYGLALAAAELAWLDSTLDRLMQQPLPVEALPGT